MKTLVHITQYIHPLKGYQENQFARVHKETFEKVIIICSDYVEIWGSDLKHNIKELDEAFEQRTGVQIIRLKTFPYSFSGRVFVSGLQRTLNRIKPDVVYSHSLSAPMTLITSRWLKRERRKRPVFTILDDHMVFVATENKFSSLFYKLLGLFFYKRYISVFDKWIAVSEETKDFIIQKFSQKLNDKIIVIPLGVDLNLFKHNEQSRIEFRKKYDIPSDYKLIVYTGKRDLFKNPFILVKVLRKLLLADQKYKLLMVGENVKQYDKRIVEYLHSNPVLINHVILQEPVSNSRLPEIYSSADVAIWPNGSSMSMLEAMACGCPVIAPDIKVNRERLSGNRGLLFNNESEDDLYKKIMELNIKSEEISKNALEWVQNYDWELLGKQSISLST